MYWPMAIMKGPLSEKTVSAFTDDGAINIDVAIHQIELWKNIPGSLVYFAYIRDDNGNIVYYEHNLDFFGTVDYNRAYKFGEQPTNGK